MVIVDDSWRLKFTKQNYSDLKSKCLNSNKLFIDDLFMPNDTSLYKKSRKINGLVWKRPSEICKNPRLVKDGVNSKDVNQGMLGNCWFVAALSLLASNRKNLEQVMPDYYKQEISHDSYCGIFKFRFWYFGEWVEIVVDDYLPTINNRLIFTHSTNQDEFWSSLIEKAYAKLNGCYEYLDGGNLSEALQDFSGGICETIKLNDDCSDKDKNKYDNFYETIKKAFDRKSLMACAINVRSNSEMEQKLACGLVKGHAYGITKVESITVKGNSLFSFLPIGREKLYMIRLRNPWGKSEWKGRWSDFSKEWQNVPKSEREKIGLSFEDDGEFFMELCDFVLFFNQLSICRTINTNLLTLRKTWSEAKVYGEWKIPDKAGGCINNIDTFCDNPQYMFEIYNNSEKSDELLVNLDQIGLRFINKDNLTIGFFIMRVEDNRKYRVHLPKPKVASTVFSNSRSVFLRQRLDCGKYVIIPSTFEQGYEGRFLLRIYTDNPNNLKEIIKDHPTPLLARCNPFSKYASCVTSLTVKGAYNLKNPNNSSGEIDTFISIRCEGKYVKGTVVKKDLNPKWNTSAIFYRYNQTKSIKVEIWINGTISDELYGEIILDAKPDNKAKILECSIRSVKNSKAATGIIEIEIQSMSNIKAL